MKALKEIAVEVREALKKEFPKCKFSVRTQYFSMGCSLHVALMSAPFEAYASEKEEHRGNQLNKYQLKDGPSKWNNICNGVHLTNEAWKVLQRVGEIATKDQWVDSDPQSDYYNTNYYFHLNVGQWKKPFKKTA
jgi:hypothetical protein